MLIKAIENGSNNNLAAKCPKPHLLKANVAAIPLLKCEKKYYLMLIILEKVFTIILYL